MSIIKVLKRIGLALSGLIKFACALTILMPVMAYADGGTTIEVMQAALFPMNMAFAELISMRIPA